MSAWEEDLWLLTAGDEDCGSRENDDLHDDDHGGLLLFPSSPREPQCVKVAFFVQKLQILQKLEKWSILIFVPKLTIFMGKKFGIFEFLRV